MTSSKMNQAIIRSVMDALSRVGYDPSRARARPPSAGFFASREDSIDAQSVPAHIINLLRMKAERGERLSGDQLARFVEKEVWSRSFFMAKGMITIDLASGTSPKRSIQEAREAIDMLARIGGPEAELCRRFLKKAIGEE